MSESIDWRWQGAEARVGVGSFFGRQVVFKERVKKVYRHPQLEQRLTSRRALQEVRCMLKARRNGIRTPAIYSVDPVDGRFVMEWIEGPTLKHTINDGTEDSLLLCRLVGKMVARLHNMDTIHGDLTTSNILIQASDPVLIDFGLSYGSNLIEDKAVDLYVLERACSSTHPTHHKALFAAVMEGYRETVKNPKPVLGKLADVQLRGRKREMIG